MTKRFIFVLVPLICFGQDIVTTRISERQVRGLSDGLDAVSSSMHTLTGRYASVMYTGSYCSNFVENYVLGFLPSVMGTYTYPFNTNNITFAEGTVLTFDHLHAPYLFVGDTLTAQSIRTTGTNYTSVGFYNGTYNINTLNAGELGLSGDMNAGTVTAGVASFRSLSTTGAVLSVLGGDDFITYTTNDISITGDVYIQARRTAANLYRNPILHYDIGLDTMWYNPVYAMPSSNGSALVTGAYPVEYRVAPLFPATGYHGVFSSGGLSFSAFGTGPRVQFMKPASDGMVDVALTSSSARPCLLSAYLLPATDASMEFIMRIPADPWTVPEMPLPPPLPAVVDPWVLPVLPPPEVPPSFPQPDRYKYASFYEDGGSEELAEPDTPPTTLEYKDMYGWEECRGYAHQHARAWAGSGAGSAVPFLSPSYKYKYKGELVSGPTDVIIGSDSGNTWGYGSWVENTYERQMFTCWHKSQAGSYFGLTKHYQQFTVSETKMSWVAPNWFYSWTAPPAWDGLHVRSQSIESGVQSVSVLEKALPPGARGTQVGPALEETTLFSTRSGGDEPEMFYFIGDTSYAFNDFGSTYKTGCSTNTLNEDYYTVYLVTNGTSLYNPGVPDYLARQWIYEPLDGTNRAPRDIELLYNAGHWLLWKERSILWVQKQGDPYLRFLRTYDGNDTPALDISNTNFPFVVDSKGSPGESGFGDVGVAYLMSTSDAEELVSVSAARDEDTDAVSYSVTVKKRRPQ